MIDHELEPYFREHLVSRGTEDDVYTPNKVWMRMLRTWRLPIVLREGTKGIQEWGTEFLPKYPGEEQRRYDIRRKASTLYGGLDDTIERLVAKPFSRPATVDGPLPKELASLEYDCDRRGNTLTQFAARMLDRALTVGMTHLLVDYPVVDEGADLRVERQLRAAPYFVHIPAERLFAWRWDTLPSGDQFLREIRWEEDVEVAAGNWSTDLEKMVHVYEFVTEAEYAEGARGTRQTFRREAKSRKWLPDSEPVTTTYAGVPLVTYYAGYVAPMECAPPFTGIADLNLAHYQVSSEHRNVLTACGVAMLARTGVSKDDAKKPVVIAPTSVQSATNPDAKLYWVEHTGAGVQSIERYLTQTEQRMETLGMSPLQARGARLTATARVLDEGKTETVAQLWVRDLEEVLTSAYGVAARWIRQELDDEFTVRIYNEFGVADGGPADAEQLLKARDARQIDHRTYLDEIRRRGLISEDADVEEIMAAVEAEGPDLAAIQPVPGFGDTEDTDEDTGDDGDEPEEQQNAA